MKAKTCSMCEKRWVAFGDVTSDPEFWRLLEIVVSGHIEEHVQDFRIEMELMSL